MKWFSLQQKTANKSLTKRSPRILNPWLIKLIVFPVIGSLILSGDVPQWQPKTLASIPPELIAGKIHQIASKITVKIIGQDFLGSGFILHQQDKNYLVLTNQHVLRAGESPFKIQTVDGKIYQGQVVTPQTSSQDDLAFLSFTSDRHKYQTAITGDYSQLQSGELVFAAGFPTDSTEHLTQSPNLPGFTFTTGKVAVVLDKPLKEGYQIAYTNDVQKGMSGGPLLTQQGKVVGVNGKHAYPLWEAPDFYEDNSQPCQPLQELITRSSLAIPVVKALALASKSNFALNSTDNQLLRLPQNNHIFSKIARESSSDLVELETISSKHCQ